MQLKRETSSRGSISIVYGLSVSCNEVVRLEYFALYFQQFYPIIHYCETQPKFENENNYYYWWSTVTATPEIVAPGPITAA